MMKKTLKLLLGLIIVFFILISITTIFIVLFPKSNIEETTYEYGVVFGAAIRPNNNMSNTLKSRMDKAIDMYHKGIIKKMVLSGAKENQIRPGEPMVMKLYAIKKMVNKDDIILDEKGDDTFKTLINIKNSIDEPTKIFISSNFHIPRIYITAKIIGIKNFAIESSINENEQNVFFIFRESVAIWYYLFISIFYKLFII